MARRTESDNGDPTAMRCAIYARYSSDLQRDSSIEDQNRKCRTLADLRGWIVLDEYVRSDEEITGATLAARPALRSLIEKAKRRPRPFDRVDRHHLEAGPQRCGCAQHDSHT